jgi:hypothetical protein
MSKMMLFAGLLLAPALITPASANWFSNPYVNINLNLGSAPNPTPDDILTERIPVLVQDTDGNVVAMIDPASGKILATAEPQTAAKSVTAPRRAAAAKPSVR